MQPNPMYDPLSFENVTAYITSTGGMFLSAAIVAGGFMFMRWFIPHAIAKFREWRQ